MTLVAHVVALASVTFFFIVAARSPQGSAPPELPRPSTRAQTCGAGVSLVAVDASADRVTLASCDPIPIALDGWSLVAGRRRVALDDFIAAAEPFEVPFVRLANRAGELTLVDPCGLEAGRMTWGPEGRARERGGGGCGQT